MTLSSYEQYEFRCCPKCGIEYAAPKTFMEEARKDPSIYFHCPNGHSRHFSESEADRLRRERDRLKQETARLEDEARLARVRADKAEAATKRLKKRTSAGTCPCCNRTFGNMAEHMKHQHPEFVADGGTKVVPIKRRA
jgi:NMD protein affecting ribosome stability and mRNA decay